MQIKSSFRKLSEQCQLGEDRKPKRIWELVRDYCCGSIPDSQEVIYYGIIDKSFIYRSCLNHIIAKFKEVNHGIRETFFKKTFIKSFYESLTPSNW